MGSQRGFYCFCSQDQALPYLSHQHVGELKSVLASNSAMSFSFALIADIQHADKVKNMLATAPTSIMPEQSALRIKDLLSYQESPPPRCCCLIMFWSTFGCDCRMIRTMRDGRNICDPQRRS